MSGAHENWETLFHNPYVAEMLRTAIKRGLEVKVSIHNNTAPLLEELANQGKIILFYDPDSQEHTFAVNGKDRIMYVGQDSPGKVITISGSRFLGDVFRDCAKRTMRGSFRVFPEKVSTVFRMIREGNSPGAIIDYIES